jgi:hypothetical protein
MMMSRRPTWSGCGTFGPSLSVGYAVAIGLKGDMRAMAPNPTNLTEGTCALRGSGSIRKDRHRRRRATNQ